MSDNVENRVILERLNGLRELTELRFDSTDQQIGALREETKTIHNVVLGNGDPGLDERVSRVERVQKTVGGVVGALLVAALTTVVTGLIGGWLSF